MNARGAFKVHSAFADALSDDESMLYQHSEPNTGWKLRPDITIKKFPASQMSELPYLAMHSNKGCQGAISSTD